MDIQLFHKYNRLVRRGLAPPLLCTYCHTQLITRLGKLDSVRLWCYTCQTYTIPGEQTCDDIRAIVGEHYIEKDNGL